MTRKQAIACLEYHNRWRRGAEIPMQSVKLLGIAIDTAIRLLKTKPRKAKQ